MPHSDFVTTTTHKTLRGPRAGLVLCREKYAKDLDKAVFPGIQGGPLMHIIAAKAVCLKEAAEPAFVDYQKQIVANARRLASVLIESGFRLVSGGTDNHLMLVDVFSRGLTGKAAEAALGKAGITVNKNAIPFDPNPPMVASGIRLGTPAVTTRGMGEREMDRIGELIARALHSPEDDSALGMVKVEVEKLCRMFPLYPEQPALTERVADVFADAGTLAAALPHFESRPSQREMADAVAATLQHGGVLLVEAGTGTGKTLAYLVPAILSGERVLISTGTKNLQEQIYFKDLGILREALGIPFTATYMKGRGNYLCLHRFDSFRESAKQRYRSALRRIGRADVSADYRGVVGENRNRRPRGNRRSARGSPVLGRDRRNVGELHGHRVPPLRGLLRHAHAFARRRVEYRGRQPSSAVRRRCRSPKRVRRSHSRMPLRHRRRSPSARRCRDAVFRRVGEQLSVRGSRARRRAGSSRPASAGNSAQDLSAAVERVRDRSQEFFRAISTNTPIRARGSENRTRMTPSTLEPFYEDAAWLMGSLDQLEATAALIKPSPPGQLSGPSVGESSKLDLAGLADRAGDLRDELRFVLKACEPDYVYFQETRGRGVFLRAAPIDVSNILREVLFDRTKATVLTSATLTIEGNFDYIRTRLGLSRPGAAAS